MYVIFCYILFDEGLKNKFNVYYSANVPSTLNHGAVNLGKDLVLKMK